MKSKTTLPRTIVSALVGEAMGTRKQFVVLVTYLASLIAIVLRVEAGDTFVPSTIAPDGIALVGPRDTYYDGSDGQLAAALPLPLGASRLQFLVTGSVATDGSLQLASPDGITKEGWVLYNFTQTRWFRGTYQGVPIGATTGVDPALFGVFFSFDFAGAAPNSLNYRSDSGIRPDPRTLDVYTPELNQPFHIGDGATANNALISSDDSIIPAGVIQTFVIPMGATHLLLGIGADDLMSDNFGYNTSGLGFRVQVFEDYVGPDQAPVIHYQPAGGTFFVGESVRLSVTTSGSRPLSYAWFKDSIPVPGATDPALLIADAKVADSGSYTATVSNEFGSVISEPAEVAITPRPWPYFEDFEATVGSEWSHRPTDTTPVGNRRFLGQFANDTVSLNLNGLPPHQAVTVSFDLYVIETWDGNGDPDGGPDIWSLSVAGGPTLLHTTFLISPWWGDAAKQAFPGDFPGTAYPARTGAVENDTLGYGWVGDAVYSLTFTFPHRADALRFDFSGQGLEGVADESWGLDNVQVSLTPADGSPHVRTSLGSGAVWAPAGGGEVLRVRTSGNRALITFGDSRFQLIDLTDPNQPAALGTGKALLEISDVVLAGDYAYVSSWDVDFLSTVEIFDFRDPTAPILCGYYDTPGYANGLAVVGTTVYVADGDAGLLILDAGNPALPIRVGEYAMPGSIDGVHATETHAYLVSGNRLIILDMTDRANPRRVGLYAAEGMISSFCVADQVAYLMLNTGKMETLDVSVPGEAKVLGTARARGQIAVSDGYVYLAMRERGLEVLAVDNPVLPQWVTGASGLGSVLDVAPLGRRLLVAARSDGLQVLELQQDLYPPLPVPVISQGVMTLSWAAMEGARLQKTTSLAPANWETVPMAEQVNTVTLPSGDAAGFFRLVLDP